MFKLYKQIKNIINYQLNFGVDASSNVVNLFNDDKTYIENAKKVFELEKLLVLDNLNKGFWLSSERVEKVFDHKFRINGIGQKKLSFYKYTLDNNNGIYSILKNKILFKTKEYIGHNILGSSVYGEINKTILCRDVETGRRQWEKPLSIYGTYTMNDKERPMDLQKFLGIYQNVLYLKVGNSLILGLDVNSGNEVYKSSYKENHQVLENLQLDHKNGIIFSIGPTHYIQFNLRSEGYELFDTSQTTSFHKVETTHLGSWEGEEIYFWEGSLNNRFGVFNRNTREIIWSDEIREVKDRFPAIKNVKHGSNKLYVHDFNNTLHIFERVL